MKNNSNMTEIVIIAQNEAKHIKRMMDALLPLHWRIHYVADRCKDDTLKLLSRYDVDVVETPAELKGRQTSFARNLGLSRCDGASSVLFLDGDRYPVFGDLRSAIRCSCSDVTCLPIEYDFRTRENFTMNYGRVINGFYSCGIHFRREAIDKILAFQNGQLFNEDLQADWGIEDTSLGDVAYHLGFTAELSEMVTLRGAFERSTVDSLDVIEKRLRFRDKLNVLWD